MSRQAKNNEAPAPGLTELCRRIAGRSPLPMAAVEGAGHIAIYVNPAFCLLLGKSAEELIGVPFARLMPEGNVSLPLLDRVYRTGEPQRLAEEEQPVGQPPWSYVMWPISGPLDRPAGILIQVTDAAKAVLFRQTAAGMNEELIRAAVRQNELLEASERLSEGLKVEIGERTRAEAALKEVSRSLEELIRVAPVGITEIAPAGTVLSWNPAMEKILGWTEEEVLGKPPPTIEEREGNADEALERVKAGEKLAGVELRRVRKDGRPVDLMVWTAPIRQEKEGRKSSVVILMDITLFKEMERINLIQQKLASLGHMATGLAHEIRNPLSGINLHIRSLERLLDGEKVPTRESREKMEAMFGMMKSASAKMESVIERILFFSKVESYRMEPIDVNLCVREAVETARVMFRDARVDVGIELQKDLPSCRGDRRLLKQALINLIVNASEVMERQEGERRIEIGTSLLCSASRDSAQIIITVADSGPGIPEENRRGLFEPYFITRKSALGFGLSITHQIVTYHGGSIRVGASRWGGALFTIGLPTDRKEIS